MHHNLSHVDFPGDNSLLCVLLVACNGVMNSLNQMFADYGFMQWLQIIGILLGMGASAYVMYNQHLTAKWKREQDRVRRAQK